MQASETSKHPVHRGRGTKVVRILHGVSVDAKWKYAGICSKIPRSQSLGVGKSDGLAMRSSAHLFVVGRGHPRSRLSAWK